MSRLTLYLLFTIGLLPITSHAQKHIQGTVKDADSKTPLPEASILVEGTQTGTIANQNGTFTLNLWQIPANGGEPQKILADISGITHIKWSPNGDRILFLTPPQDNLWVMQLSGTAFQTHINSSSSPKY